MIQARYLSRPKKDILYDYRKTTNSQSQYSIATRLLSLYSKDTIVNSDDDYLFEQIVGQPRNKCDLKSSTKITYMQSIRRFQKFLKGEVRNIGL